MFPEYEDYTKYCATLRSRLVRRIGAFSNVLIKRKALLQCEERLQGVHAGEDTVIGKVLRRHGFKHITVKEVVGFHYHKNAVSHHIMAYCRAGESARMKLGATLALIMSVKFLTLQLLQLGLFTIAEKRLSRRLLSFVSLLSTLFIAGIMDSPQIKDKITNKIRSEFPHYTLPL